MATMIGALGKMSLMGVQDRDWYREATRKRLSLSDEKTQGFKSSESRRPDPPNRSKGPQLPEWLNYALGLIIPCTLFMLVVRVFLPH